MADGEGWMIARIWHGAVPISKSDDYLDLMGRIALPEYRAIRGNRGAWCLHHTEGAERHFEMLTFWDDTVAIKRFAGDDYSKAKYYDFDSDYLIEKEPHVRHYEVSSDSSPDPSRPTHGDVRDENMIARVWRGVVPIEKGETYFRYLRDFGFRDYQKYAGNRGIHLLRRTEEARMHFLFLSFWESRQAIVAYAGDDIGKAHYYTYDLECLIDPPLNVEHYEVLSSLTSSRGLNTKNP
jgi:heme-degrading monooxygenase HmoA